MRAARDSQSFQQQATIALPGEPGFLERVNEILSRLYTTYPGARCSLLFANPLQLLIATILSAQCTDERVNQVTPALFQKYQSAQAFAEASPEEVAWAIRSIGFHRSKTRYIQGACRIIADKFQGQVPRTLPEILELPGVARKTANVVLGNAYHVVVGIAVDTHVGRISRRLGFTHHTDPVQVERDLMEILPKSSWIDINHQLIAHGRMICKALRPLCGSCPLADCCPSAGLYE